MDAGSLARPPGWREALGQVSAAQSHLSNNDVGQGDVFLFWGLYRCAVRSPTGSWSFAGIAEHRLFGWPQVNEVLASRRFCIVDSLDFGNTAHCC
jgi:hypothetical protein